MDEKEVKKVLAPCGLSCGKCVAFSGGPVQEHAQALAEALGPNFAAYAERFTAMGRPEFADYPAFRKMLDHFASGSCTGCRGTGCIFLDCKVTGCATKRGVDYCFQCADFPCADHGFPERLAALWQKNNEMMRELGILAYYDKVRNRPRYP